MLFFSFRQDFLLNVGNSEIYRDKSFPTTENAQIVVNRCAT